MCALMGTADARGFRQWQEVGRHVKKGSKAFPILGPILKKRTESDASGQTREIVFPIGFTSIPVFAFEETDGEPLQVDAALSRWIDSLPLLDVARAWNISVSHFNGVEGRALGKFSFRGSIALGVKNLSTWAHEMMHAADHRLGNLTERGQHWRSETVAELGSSILLECLGYSVESDRGGAFEYISGYARAESIEPITACTQVLTRTCAAVSLLLEEAEKLVAAEGGESCS